MNIKHDIILPNFNGSDFSNLLDSTSTEKINNIINEEKLVP
jgi:hypothetical protein